MKKNNKGYAYMKESEKYKTVYGNSEQEILDTLQKWNQSRTKEQQFVYCNIGTLDPEMDKYIRYQKYDVATGRNISSLWLNIPGMSKEEFKQTIQEFKDKGARFHSVKKQWYISPDNPNIEFFKDYLQDGSEKTDEKVGNPVLRAIREREKTIQETSQKEEVNEYSKELVMAFQKVAEADSKQMEISKEKLSLLQELVKKDIEINKDVSEMTRQILDAYGAEIRSLDTGNGTPWVVYRQPERESVAPEEVTIDREDYLVSISRDAEDNRCTIYYKDGRLPVDLRGDQFNVHFPSSSEAHVMDIVQGYFENQIREYPEEATNYEVGDSIDVYVPKWNYVENAEIGNSCISGLSKIKGTVESIEMGAEITYCVKEEQGLYSYVQQQEVYSSRQVEVLKRAIKDELSPDKFNLLANPELGSAQMEELRFAFKDGFSLEQVQDIAAVAKKSWQISLYRYGMQHGIKLDEIKGICANESKKWLECHQEVDNRIQHRRQQRVQELTSQGFQANTGLIKKLENIDHLTGKSNTLRDICNAFKEGTYEHTAAGEVIKSLGRELQHQELQMQAAMEPEP